MASFVNQYACQETDMVFVGLEPRCCYSYRIYVLPEPPHLLRSRASLGLSFIVNIDQTYDTHAFGMHTELMRLEVHTSIFVIIFQFILLNLDRSCSARLWECVVELNSMSFPLVNHHRRVRI